MSIAGSASGERLPFTRLAHDSGLVDDVASVLVEDTRGFLWIGTVAGVSRFDGALFRAYHVREGGASQSINAILQTADGDIWFATNGGGVARLDRTAQRTASEEPPLTRYRLGENRRTNRVNALVQDADATIWAGTDGGLFRLASGGKGFERVALGLTGVADDTLFVPTIALGSQGELWLGTERGLLRRSRNETTTRFALADHPNQTVRRVAVDAQGLVWSSSQTDVRVLRAAAESTSLVAASVSAAPCPIVSPGRPALPSAAGASCALTPAHGLPDGLVEAMSPTADGRLFIATNRGGVVEMMDGRLRTIAEAHDRYRILGLLEDRRGTLWLGTDVGVLKLARSGLVTYDAEDGFRGTPRRIFGGPRGTVFIVTDDESIHEPDGRRFRSARPQYPSGVGKPTWGSWYLPDPVRGWWVPTNAGLCLYDAGDGVAALGEATASRCYTTLDGLPSDDIAYMLFDSSGALWIGARATSGPVVARRDPTSGALAVIDVEGLSPISTPVDFAEDSDGALWIGFRDGGVARCDTRRCVRVLATAPMSRLLVDRAGRVWIATTAGLIRVDDRRAAPVTAARHYTTREGLSSDSTYALAEDAFGTVYVGTSRGVDRLDPVTGVVRHLSEADGLAGGAVLAAYADTQGRLWFGARQGLSTYVPRDEPEASPASPAIAYIRTGDAEWPLSEFGAARVEGVELPSPDARLEIGFFAADPARPPRLQYRLRDVDAWADAGPAPVAIYPRLAPGRYDFEVRALDDAGVASAELAVVQFRVPPPFWQRWPFLALVGSFVGMLGYAVHRVRLGRLVALERIRTHIATDLHDDIGSTLTRIAMLAERTRRHAGGDRAADAPLGAIATASRDLVDTMSDIVWAVNPRHDSLSDLTHRMRRFAGETLGDSSIALSFAAPEYVDVALGPDVRRDLYLVLKECVTNVAKHAHPTVVEIAFELEGHWLKLRVSDNGRGFDPRVPSDGAGLTNLRTRTARVGGTLTIDSIPGQGTTVTLAVDLGRPATLSLRE